MLVITGSEKTQAGKTTVEFVLCDAVNIASTPVVSTEKKICLQPKTHSSPFGFTDWRALQRECCRQQGGEVSAIVSRRFGMCAAGTGILRELGKDPGITGTVVIIVVVVIPPNDPEFFV